MVNTASAASVNVLLSTAIIVWALLRINHKDTETQEYSLTEIEIGMLPEYV